MRRALAQRLRRLKAASKPPSAPPTSVADGESRRLQGASVISEADIRAEHPVIIGLISMLIGSDDISRVEATYRQLWIQGKRIISTDSCASMPKSPIISIFEDLKAGSPSPP